jgi:hypothetical protein
LAAVLVDILSHCGAENRATHKSLRARSSNGWSIGFLIACRYAASDIFQLVTLDFVGLG